MTSSPHGPYVLGLHTCYNGRYKGQRTGNVSESQKVGLSSDWSLQLDSMKSESLVIADQHAAVNTFPGLVHTARHTMGVVWTRSRRQPTLSREAGAEGLDGNWGEVVTR